MYVFTGVSIVWGTILLILAACRWIYCTIENKPFWPRAYYRIITQSQYEFLYTAQRRFFGIWVDVYHDGDLQKVREYVKRRGRHTIRVIE